MRLALELVGGQAAAGRRDHEQVERAAGEDAARRLRDGKVDRPVELARRRVSANLARAPDRGPQAAVGIDAHPVDEADLRREPELYNPTALGQLAAREVERERVDPSRPRIDVVERRAVRAP